MLHTCSPDDENKTGANDPIADQNSLTKYLPSFLTELFNAERELIKGGRPEMQDFWKQGVETEGKLVKDWKAIPKLDPTKPNDKDAKREEAKSWFDKLRCKFEADLATEKARKSKIENDLKLGQQVPLLAKQEVEALIASLKDLPKQRDDLKTKIEKLEKDIEAAKGSDALENKLKQMKTDAEGKLGNLAKSEKDLNEAIVKKITEWRNARNELVKPGVVELEKKAQRIELLTKKLECMKNFEQDIIDTYLNPPLKPTATC